MRMRGVRIERVRGFEVLDSRGNPTVRAEVLLSDGSMGAASVPPGASTGMHEAVELRDGESRYNGRGVRKAVSHVDTEIAAALCACPSIEQHRIDETLLQLDGTENKSRLGANAMLAVSLAAAKAAARHYHLPLYRYLGGVNAVNLPVPMMNILNGGAHASNNVDIQEFMIMPKGACCFREGLRMGAEVYHALAGVLKSRGLSTTVGDEGGFAPDLSSDEEAIECVLDAIHRAGFTTDEIQLSLDAASSEWYEDGVYRLSKRGTQYDSDGLIAYWNALCDTYPICSLEDALGEEDWDGWEKLTATLGGKVQLVGDDLFVTNVKFLRRGIDSRVANAILVKCNQIGTLTESLSAIRMAQTAGYGTIISHRSGETEDATIADLAVAVGAGQIKTGAPCRSDRVAKYNRLLRIEAELRTRCTYGTRLS